VLRVGRWTVGLRLTACGGAMAPADITSRQSTGQQQQQQPQRASDAAGYYN